MYTVSIAAYATEGASGPPAAGWAAVVRRGESVCSYHVHVCGVTEAVALRMGEEHMRQIIGGSSAVAVYRTAGVDYQTALSLARAAAITPHAPISIVHHRETP